MLLKRKLKYVKIATLESLIESNPDVRELKRGLAVKMAIEEYPYQRITQLLGVRIVIPNKIETDYFSHSLDLSC